MIRYNNIREYKNRQRQNARIMHQPLLFIHIDIFIPFKAQIRNFRQYYMCSNTFCGPFSC